MTKSTGVGPGRYRRDTQQPAVRSANARKASKKSPWRGGPMCTSPRAEQSYKQLSSKATGADHD